MTTSIRHPGFQTIVEGRIQVHPKTGSPTKLWDELKMKQLVQSVTPLPLDTPMCQDKLRFVCISDTHNVKGITPDIVPDGDVLLHAGDFSNVGHPQDIEQFNEFLGQLPHRHKIVIAGNHELTFDPAFLKGDDLNRFGLHADVIHDYMAFKNISQMSDVLTNCTYLKDSETTIHGIRIYGSPWQPKFGGWGFNLIRGKACLEKWNLIPAGIDVLITHGPPLGHGDLCYNNVRAGCVELLHTIQHRVKPKYHIFGHIHEGYGITTDGVTIYINASTCTLRYRPDNPAIIFDLPLPEGHSKNTN